MNLVVDECTRVSPSRHQNISLVIYQGNRIVEWKLQNKYSILSRWPGKHST
ncbi:unnamed protein product [Staurois parvus]|uniref:Uncharacterized protein n=1 Tax=Staurois parvus TaxID=386267 RepID=A0ABN9GSF9_9NEOB|nr:unnamed protein product [Staurois parvus]